MVGRSGWRRPERADRVAAAAFFIAFLSVGLGITVLVSDMFRETTRFADPRVLLILYWAGLGVPAVAATVSTWRGSQWGRRLLGLLALVGSAGAFYELGHEQFDPSGVAGTVVAAALFAVALVATLVHSRQGNDGDDV